MRRGGLLGCESCRPAGLVSSAGFATTKGKSSDDLAQPPVLDQAQGLGQGQPAPAPHAGFRPVVHLAPHTEGVDLHLAGASPLAMAVRAERRSGALSVQARFLECLLGRGGPGGQARLDDAFGKDPALGPARRDEQNLQIVTMPAVGKGCGLTVYPGGIRRLVRLHVVPSSRSFRSFSPRDARPRPNALFCMSISIVPPDSLPECRSRHPDPHPPGGCFLSSMLSGSERRSVDAG